VILWAIEAVAAKIAIVDVFLPSGDLVWCNVNRAFGAKNLRFAGCDEVAGNELEIVHSEIVDARLIGDEVRREF
jgi:hypothetical protein